MVSTRPRRAIPPRHAVALALAVAVLAPAILAPGLLAAGKCAGRENDADCFLYLIARKCLDTNAENYCGICPLPRPGYCPGVNECERTTEVWTGSQRYAVLRAESMCWCPAVTHGLVVPTGAIAGVEDPDRPNSIWKFAWDVSTSVLPPETTALVANAPDFRDQNQLHVHIVPLDPAKSAALEAAPFAAVHDLYAVWQTADQVAISRGLKSFGILVHAAGEGTWHVHVENAPLTEAYTALPACPPKPEPKKRR